MNWKVLCLFLLLAISSLHAQQTNTCSTATGPNNEALKWLGNTGVYLNNEPEFPDVTTCSGEFKTKGTCCEIESLKTKIASIHSRMTTKWTAYIDRMAKVQTFFPGLKKLAKLLSVTLINSKIAQLNSVGAAIKLNDFLSIVPRDETSINALINYINNIEQNLEDYKYYGQTCFESLKNARANIFCVACSGAAGDYTSPQSEFGFRYRVTSDTCTRLVNTCFPVYKFNFMLASAIQTLVVLKARAAGPRAKVIYRSDVNLSSDVLATLFDTFVSCNVNHDTEAMTCGNDSEIDKHRQRICSMGFMANKHIGFVEGDSTIVSDMDGTNIDQLIEQEAVQNKRLLQNVFEPAMGISVGGVGVAYSNLLSTSTGLIPSGTVDPSTISPPNTNTSSAKIITATLLLLLGLFIN